MSPAADGVYGVNDVSFLLSDLQHIEQDERVSMGLNGDLYFSHAVDRDSRRDYCCFAAFPRIRTIVQKTAMSVIVKTSEKTRFASFTVCSRPKVHPSPALFLHDLCIFYFILSCLCLS